MTQIPPATITTAPRQAVPIGQAIGQAVGQAETALSRLLAGILAETGTPRETYLALQRMAALGDGPLRDDLARDLNETLGLDLWAAGNLVNGLVSAGLLAAGEGGDDAVRLTPAGAELRGRLQDSVRAVNAPLWESLDPAALNTTIKTLREITARARAPHPVGRAGEDSDG